MQRRNLAIILAVLVLLLVIGIPTFLLINGSNSTKVAGTPIPTVAVLGPTLTAGTTSVATTTATATVTGSATTVGSASFSAEPGDTVVTLKWLAITGAASYDVYRDGSTTPLNADLLTDTQYMDVGLTNSRTYTYTIAPVDSAGTVGTMLPSIKVTVGPK